jgi:PHD/YefM family antitoxin component YafN of YafNO toxin-antitoxin module
MITATHTSLGRNLKSYIGKVFNGDPLVVSRKNNGKAVFVAARDDLAETDYLLSHQANADHLQKSIDQHKSGDIKERRLYENE